MATGRPIARAVVRLRFIAYGDDSGPGVVAEDPRRTRDRQYGWRNEKIGAVQRRDPTTYAAWSV